MPTSVIAVIIGRAGSKGLPAKNSRSLAGRPIVEFSIQDALNASAVDRTILSTDCPALSASARNLGIPVISRPPDLASDTATVDSAVRHAILSDQSSHSTVVILYANVPIRPDDLIDRAVHTLHSTACHSVQSYSSVAKHHPFWMVRLDADARVSPYVPNTVFRRQDLPPLFLPDGGVIAVTRDSLFTTIPGQPHAFLGTDRRGIISPPGSVVDIDLPADLALAQSMLSSTPSALSAAP